MWFGSLLIRQKPCRSITSFTLIPFLVVLSLVYQELHFAFISSRITVKIEFLLNTYCKVNSLFLKKVSYTLLFWLGDWWRLLINLHSFLFIVTSVLKYSWSISEAATGSAVPPELFYKKGVLKNFTKFTAKHLCQSLFCNKVAGLRHRCFPALVIFGWMICLNEVISGNAEVIIIRQNLRI